MIDIDDMIAFLQELKANGERKVATIVVVEENLDWNVETRSLAETLFGEDFDPDCLNEEDDADYKAFRKALWDKMVYGVDDNLGEHSGEHINFAIEYAFQQLDEEDWNDKSDGIGKVIHDIQVKRLMRENDWDADTAKSMLAIS